MNYLDVSLSCLARSTAKSLGLSEPDVKRARLKPFREDGQHPKFHVVFSHVADRDLTLRLNCCHHDPGQIVSLSEA